MIENDVQQVPMDEFKRKFGEKFFDTALKIILTLKQRLGNEERFTGKIVFTINCRDGGIGGIEAFIQKKL